VGLLQEDRIDDAALQCVVRLLCRPAEVHVGHGVLDLIGLAELDPELRFLAEVAEADRRSAEQVLKQVAATLQRHLCRGEVVVHPRAVGRVLDARHRGTVRVGGMNEECSVRCGEPFGVVFGSDLDDVTLVEVGDGRAGSG
jgi:hypothetical protein